MDTRKEDDQREIDRLKQEVKDLKERLQKYTNPSRTKVYYEKNRDKLIGKMKEYNTKRKCV